MRIALEYHAASKHHPQRYAPGPGGLDWITQPDPFRSFAGAARLRLALAADKVETPWSALTQAAGVNPCPFDHHHLSILFELAFGLSAWKSYRGNTWALRCNPSSGNLHPTEAYLVCPTLEGIDSGVYHYVSRDHVIEQRAVPMKGLRCFPGPGVMIGLTSIHWREAWKYGMRAYRYCQHDVGHALAALRYAAAVQGWSVTLQDHWSDIQIAALLGIQRAADFADAEQEAPDLLCWVGAARISHISRRNLPAPLWAMLRGTVGGIV